MSLKGGVEAGAGDGIQAHHLGDAVHVLQVVAQVAHLGGGQVIVHQDKVAGGHAKVLTQLVGAHDAGQVLGQRIEQGVTYCNYIRKTHKKQECSEFVFA